MSHLELVLLRDLSAEQLVVQDAEFQLDGIVASLPQESRMSFPSSGKKGGCACYTGPGSAATLKAWVRVSGRQEVSDTDAIVRQRHSGDAL